MSLLEEGCSGVSVSGALEYDVVAVLVPVTAGAGAGVPLAQKYDLFQTSSEVPIARGVNHPKEQYLVGILVLRDAVSNAEAMGVCEGPELLFRRRSSPGHFDCNRNITESKS